MYSKGEITIGGKLRPVYIGVYTGEIICELMNIPLSEYSKKYSTAALLESTGKELRIMLYAALRAGAEYNGLQIDFTDKTVGFWLDDIAADEITNFVNIIASGNPPPDMEKKTEVNNPN